MFGPLRYGMGAQMSREIPMEGESFEVEYPFVLETLDFPPGSQNPDDIGRCERYRPGVSVIEDYENGHHYAVFKANGTGQMLLTVVGRYKPPGKYHERIFYTRKWRGPDGVVFGKNGLLVTTVAAFRRMLGGYRHPFEVVE